MPDPQNPEIKPLPGTSPAYDEAESYVRKAIFDYGFKEVFDRVISVIPWLGYPVIKQVFSFVSEKLLWLFYTIVEQQLALIFIDGKVDIENKKFKEAVNALKAELSKPKENQDANQVEAAKQEVRSRLRDLIRFKP